MPGGSNANREIMASRGGGSKGSSNKGGGEKGSSDKGSKEDRFTRSQAEKALEKEREYQHEHRTPHPI